MAGEDETNKTPEPGAGGQGPGAPGSDDGFEQTLSLTEAARLGDEERVRELLDAGARLNDVNPQSGMSALHYAASSGARRVVAVLQERDGLFYLQRDKWGRLPSALAYEVADDPELGEMLIEAELAQADEVGVPYEDILTGKAEPIMFAG